MLMGSKIDEEKLVGRQKKSITTVEEYLTNRLSEYELNGISIQELMRSRQTDETATMDQCMFLENYPPTPPPTKH